MQVYASRLKRLHQGERLTLPPSIVVRHPFHMDNTMDGGMAGSSVLELSNRGAAALRASGAGSGIHMRDGSWHVVHGMDPAPSLVTPGVSLWELLTEVDEHNSFVCLDTDFSTRPATGVAALEVAITSLENSDIGGKAERERWMSHLESTRQRLGEKSQD
jgi:hypothetical protein